MRTIQKISLISGVDCQWKTNLESNNRKLLDFLKFTVDTIKVNIMVKIKQ